MTGPERSRTASLTVIVENASTPSAAVATVRLTGAAQRAATTSFGRDLTFDDLPPGTYTVATTIRTFACLTLTAEVRGGQGTTVTVSCTRTAGRITGTVASEGAPLAGARVSVTPHATGRSTDRSGTFTFVVPAGDYSLTATHQHHVCPVQVVRVEADRTLETVLACAPKPTGAISGRVTVDGASIPGALVQLDGPVHLTTTTGQGTGRFGFDELPPGIYTLSISRRLTDCRPATADVEAARTTAVDIDCTFRNVILGSDIEGDWFYRRQLRSGTGTCPAPLPEDQMGRIAFDSSTGSLTIAGLDPDLNIVGDYDPDTRSFAGGGRVVRGDGSSIQTELSARFDFDQLLESDLVLDTAEPPAGLVRRHRDAAGSLVCTEVYDARGVS